MHIKPLTLHKMHYFEGKYCGTVYFFMHQKLYRTVLVTKICLVRGFFLFFLF